MKYQKLILVIIVSFISLHISLSQTLHAIIFADTKDTRIGKSVAVDKRNMSNQFDLIKAACSLTLAPYYYDDVYYSKLNFVDVIQGLSVSSNDVIFCYIASHGTHGYDDEGYFPNVDFKDGFLSLEAIHNYLVDNYSANLVITMGDMCNVIQRVKSHTVIGDRSSETVCQKCLKPNEISNYKKLFKETRGNILLNGAEKSKSASGNDIEGGYFTNSFITKLRSDVKSSNTSTWKKLSENVRSATYNKSSRGGQPYSPIIKANIYGGGNSSFSYLTGLSSSRNNNYSKSSSFSSRSSTYTDPTTGMEFIYVEGGSFYMGCASEQCDYCGCKPVHKVTLSAYYIGKYEVTQKQWRQVMGTSPSHHKYCDHCPVEKVSWNDAQEFIRKLNAKTYGKTYSLPTEAQWEFAARGGNKSRGYKYAGSSYIFDVAWFLDNSNEETHPVGTKRANELGIYDMTGNISEWCLDRYGSYYSYSQTNPKGSREGSSRVSRGGHLFSFAQYCSVVERSGCSPDCISDGIGFRLVLVSP